MQLVAARAVHRVAQALTVLAVRPPAASRHEGAAVVRALVHRDLRALRLLAARVRARTRRDLRAVRLLAAQAQEPVRAHRLDPALRRARAQVHDRVHQIERVPVVRVGPQEVLIDLVPGTRQALGLAVAAMIAPLAGQTPKMDGLTARH